MEGQYFNLLTHSITGAARPSVVTLRSVLQDIKNLRFETCKGKPGFMKAFMTDPRVISHVDGIIKLELETGALDALYADTRRAQLLEWLGDYYYIQLTKISNLDTSTQNHLIQLHAAYIVFSHILPTIFQDGIWVNRDTFKQFKERAASLEHPLLLLPNHQSHIDYIIIHFLYVLSSLETPLVIAGENLNVPIFGPILKRFGAIFIKRRFTDADFWYKPSMKRLLSEKLKSNPQVELFIEGTRSRNGKLMLPKTGFVQLIQESLNGRDAYVQPISLVYEKPYEFHDYLVELNGMDKRQESFSSILSSGLNLLVLKKSPNFGKLVINFDNAFLTLNAQTNIQDLCNMTMQRIHQIGYITEISIVGMALTTLFYRDVHVKKISKLDTCSVVKQLTELLIQKTSTNDHLFSILNMDDETLMQTISSLLRRFLDKHILITDDAYIILEETSLVYFKNSLLSHFVSEMFLIKTKNHYPTLDILKRLFNFEFLTSLIDEQTEIHPEYIPLFGKLLDPFIESYEIVLKNLRGVYATSFKTWLHLLYASSPNVTYKESMNKSNLLYAIYTLQYLGLVKITKVKNIEVVDEQGLLLFQNYLHSLKLGQPPQQEGSVARRVLQIKSKI
ncbi:acyltransferase-domain-containing protein [Cyberlindnera jadinii NRRL Y-1542]|uniref:Acyltransferase-domain-containing protein n=1 Tax=Cyberlindnera jadinii (strain ATCC 18201 / CBS 1600 / BCRC 20928 / JCM 3617 / NBRC 0987 / NRRL Y-1542) TaxID=983966 RepID=A0A1E4RZN2_CYBJN|nr:acyltransferase-domain-containing protein [Cyberlindnera jadinii NRRL Y-1542]ODV72710.1 acyltransferase-domain-containing protein [Cyberlindnera jadinii NRRL Y-1542]